MVTPVPSRRSPGVKDLLDGFREAAAALPDSRPGRNKRYSVGEAAACAFAPFFLQDPSFLSFQRRMEDEEQRSNCQTLFDTEAIPTDNTIRNVLDGCPSDAFDPLFPLGLDTLRDNGALEPFLRLDKRILIALDGIEFHKSYSIHCDICSTRHTGSAKRRQFFHSMVAAAVVADGHSRALPLMPEFIQPQSDPAACDTALGDNRQKQDCERNAAKRWIGKHAATLAPLPPRLPRRRPVLLPPLLPAPLRQ